MSGATIDDGKETKYETIKCDPRAKREPLLVGFYPMGKTDVQTRTIPGDMGNTNSITEAQVSTAIMEEWEKQLFIGNPPRGEDFHPAS